MRGTVRLAIGLVGLAFAGFAAGGPIEDLPAGHWYQVPNSRLEDLDPCPARNCGYSGNEGQKAVIDDWNGGAFATKYGTKGGLIVWGGGHGGYLGNEIYVFDLGTLRWNRVTEPVANPSCNLSEAELQDGSPCSPHAYDYLEYHPGTNSFVKLGSASDHFNGGGGSPRVHLFSFDTKQWRRGARKQTFLTHEGASTGYDPNRDVFWLLPAFDKKLGKYDPSANGGAGAWTEYPGYNIDIDGVGAVNPERDLYVVVDGRYKNQVIAFDLKNPEQAPAVLTTTGDRTIEQDKGNGFEWDPVTKQFVAWHSGASVYTLRAPSGDWRTGSWVWTRMDPAPGNTVVPTAPNMNSTYSRWRYAPAVNAFVVVNRTNDNVFIYKLSSNPGVTNPTITLTANPTQVNAQGSTTLTWSTTSADACNASASPAVNGWSGTKAMSGNQSLGPLSATTGFTLACTNTGGGSASKSVTVTVGATPAPTVSLTANPTTVPLNGSSQLSWTTSNATSCTASGGWSGSKAVPNGSQSVGPLSASTTFNLSCTGAGGTTPRSVTVNLQAAPVVNFSANPISVTTGGRSTLTWSSTNASGCVASGAWAGNKAVSGSTQTAALSSTSTFTLQCSGGGGATTRNVTVTVTGSPPPPPVPTVNLSANPTAVNVNGSSMLSWTSTNASSCTASGGWSGSKSTSGSASTGALSTTRTFTLVCTGAGGTGQPDSVTVTVTGSPPPPPMPTVNLSADPTAVNVNGSSMLSWTSTNASSCTASGGWSGSKSISGSASTGALSTTRTFTLVCTGAGGTGQPDSVTVTVNAGGGGGGEPPPTDDTGSGGGAFGAYLLLGLFIALLQRGNAVLRMRLRQRARQSVIPLTIMAMLGVGQEALADPDSDFQFRASQPGVVRAIGFDTAAQVSNYVLPDGVFESSGSGWDQSVKASGPGALRFNVPGGSGPNTSGNWRINFADDRSLQFDENSEFYVQWRQRFDSGQLNTDFTDSDGFKQIIIGEADRPGQPEAGSCTEMHLVVQNVAQRGLPMMYHSCGRYTPFEQFFPGSGTIPSGYKIQNAIPAPYCLHNGNYGPPCFRYRADEWMTFQVRVKLGPRGTGETSLGGTATGFTNSTVQMWAANEGQPSVLIHDWPGLVLWETDGRSYGKVWLLPYQTNKNSSQQHPTTHTWYDEFIISRNRIPDPQGAAATNPTITLTANPTQVNAQGSTTLTWSTTSADACNASASPAVNGWSGTKAMSGNQSLGPLSATTGFTLACTNTGGGSASKSVTVTVGATPAPTVSLTANPTTVPLNGSSQLSWTTSNATSCTASGGWSGSKAVPNGSQSVGPLSASTTFNLSCTGAGGTTPRSVTVNLQAAPVVNFSANPISVTTGGRSTLTWSSTNASGCVASGAWAGNKAVSGSTQTAALSSTSTFTLQCSGGGGATTRNVTVTVTGSPPPPPVPTVNLSANPTAVNVNGSSMLSWTSTNASSCTASGGWSGSKSTSGSASTGALSTTRTFTLVCTGAGGTGQPDSVTVTVTGSPPPPPMPTVNLSADPTAVNVNGSSMLSWTSTNASSCTASGGWSGSKSISGSASTGALSTTRTFTLVCTGAGGTGQPDSVTVTVNAGGGGGGEPPPTDDTGSGGGAFGAYLVLGLLSTLFAQRSRRRSVWRSDAFAGWRG